MTLLQMLICVVAGAAVAVLIGTSTPTAAMNDTIIVFATICFAVFILSPLDRSVLRCNSF